MHRAFDLYDGAAIIELVFYPCVLVGAGLLSFRHGLKNSSTCRYLIIFALIRIVSGALRLATIDDADNIKLTIGWTVTEGLGLGPLLLVNLSLLIPVFESIHDLDYLYSQRIYRRFVQMLVLAAVILTAIGGTEATYSTNITAGGIPHVDYPILSKAGMVLLMITTGLLIAATGTALINKDFLSKSESRIVMASAFAMPLLIVRVVYSAMKILGGLQASVYQFLSMSTLMELIAVLLYEGVSMTL